MASNWAPVRGAPPQIQDPTIVLAVSGTGRGGIARLEEQASRRGGKGLRKWNRVRRLISIGEEYSMKSPEWSSIEILPMRRLRASVRWAV